jgi:histidine ammonia-lyase
MQEDHVSMGWSAARKLRRSIDGLVQVLAVELLTAARALDLRRPLTAAPGAEAVHAAVRRRVEGVGPDRFMSPELRSGYELIVSGEVLAAAEGAVGKLE